ncbi:hypothetical protein [Micromonospora sp. Mcm103]|uniref:hypothetical protein n=1 Tax=Micromonospora sp. Mcm103 TaxID=2926015 RepID=UPI0021C7CDB3|nr:hypothetical protein [Micromonospora sp. Mcm103]
MTRARTAVALSAALLLALAGCGTEDDSGTAAPSGPAGSTQPAPKATADPYDVYLKLAPKDAPKISREDAQARALLGCGQKWAPGTVDAALAEAYADLCKQSR